MQTDLAPVGMQALVTFQEEDFRAVLPELQPYWPAQESEVGLRDGHMVLDVDVDTYTLLAHQGYLSVVTMRGDEVLVGYFISVLHAHLHYRQTLCAFAEAFYVAPAWRHGWWAVQLFRHAEVLLHARGARRLYADDSVWHAAGALFRRCGWAPTGTMYTKWLGD